MSRILIIDDDLCLCELLAKYLQREGFEFDFVHDGSQGAEQALALNYALVVLDVMLPGLSGLDVLAAIRRKSIVPVFMLTARGDEVDRIVGLEMGADDYISKPFNPRELVARIRAVLRRTRFGFTEVASACSDHMAVGDVEIDKSTRSVTRSGVQLSLTVVEFDLLEALLRSAGRIVTREELVRSVLGRRLSPSDRSIDTHVSNLRRKLGHETDGIERIRTIRSVGYIYAKHDAAQKE